MKILNVLKNYEAKGGGQWWIAPSNRPSKRGQEERAANPSHLGPLCTHPHFFPHTWPRSPAGGRFVFSHCAGRTTQGVANVTKTLWSDTLVNSSIDWWGFEDCKFSYWHSSHRHFYTLPLIFDRKIIKSVRFMSTASTHTHSAHLSFVFLPQTQSCDENYFWGIWHNVRLGKE